MKFILSGGGTGGHIFPAIAVADELKKRYENAEILFIGAKGRMEEKVVPANGYEIKLLNIAGLQRRKIYKNFGVIKNFISAVGKCKKILDEYKPDSVIGTGGFAMSPVIYAAQKRNIPTVMIEGNSYPGISVRFLAKKSGRVIINFADTKNHLKKSVKCIQIPFPVRGAMKLKDKSDSAKLFGFNNNNKTVFIFGGSQGAESINKEISRIQGKLTSENINIIWQAGKANAVKYKTVNENVKIFEFINNMDDAYSAADLVISRAGISSIMELSFMRKPVILVPYPYASENHQEKNALALTSKDAAMMIKEKDINSLYDSIISLVNDDGALKKMSENIAGFYDKSAPEKIVDEILKTIN